MLMKADAAAGTAAAESRDRPAGAVRGSAGGMAAGGGMGAGVGGGEAASRRAVSGGAGASVRGAGQDHFAEGDGIGEARARDAREGELLRRAHAGDRAAFGAFVLSSQDRLFTVLLRIMGDREEARELSQETYLRALQNLPSFRGGSAPYTWLYRIAVNLAIGRLRKVRRRRLFSLDAASSEGVGESPVEAPAAAALSRERASQVLSALGRLDAEYRAVLVMRDVDDLDYREIADVLELPLGTVKSRIFRARLALREELQKYFGAPATPGAQAAVQVPGQASVQAAVQPGLPGGIQPAGQAVGPSAVPSGGVGRGGELP